MTDVPPAPQPPEQPAQPAASPPAANPYAQPSSTPYGQADGAPYGSPSYSGTPQEKTNVLAIVALSLGIAGLTILPLLGSIGGIITGHMSLGQIKRTGEKGRALGLTGLILGYVGLAFGVLLIILFVSFFGLIASSGMMYDDFS